MGNIITPKHFKVVSGRGTGDYELIAFDNALIDAGIGDYNIVKVSSSLPPGCQYTDLIDIEKGSILHAAYVTVMVGDQGRKSSSVAVALPENPQLNGVIFEATSESGYTERDVRRMCSLAMENRSRPVKEIYSTSMEVYAEEGFCTCGIAAVVMW